MNESTPVQLSRRERQIMDVVYALGRATVAEVLERLPDPPTYNSVRASIRILEEKGHLRHEQDGPRYIFLPTLPAEAARESALRHLLKTFFDGSAEGAVAALLEMQGAELSQEEYERLAARIAEARSEGR